MYLRYKKMKFCKYKTKLRAMKQFSSVDATIINYNQEQDQQEARSLPKYIIASISKKHILAPIILPPRKWYFLPILQVNMKKINKCTA